MQILFNTNISKKHGVLPGACATSGAPFEQVVIALNMHYAAIDLSRAGKYFGFAPELWKTPAVLEKFKILSR